VGGLDVSMIAAESERLRLGERFLEFGGKFVESHEYVPRMSIT
jgi:hypothetical protein